MAPPTAPGGRHGCPHKFHIVSEQYQFYPTIGSEKVSTDVHTNFNGDKWLCSTLISLLKRYMIRKGTTRSSRHAGRRDKIDSSNSRVKSKPPRQLPAHGPNVSSTRGQESVATIVVCGISRGKLHYTWRSTMQFCTVSTDAELNMPAKWDHKGSSRICCRWYATCETAACFEARSTEEIFSTALLSLLSIQVTENRVSACYQTFPQEVQLGNHRA